MIFLGHRKATVKLRHSNGEGPDLGSGVRASIYALMYWQLEVEVGIDKFWLGRQLVDHLGLEPGMLWVRIPPELL